jgi:fluoride exporter
VRIVWIGVAGFLGAVARYGVEGVVSRRTGGQFPWGTLVVNTSGCFVLGFLFTLFTERFLPHPNLRSALTVGLLGAYTTFSTFSLETVRLIEGGAVWLASANAIASLALGIVFVYLGIFLGRAV